MTDKSSILDALWSGFTKSEGAAPAWFVSLIACACSRLPASVADDFTSLLAIELLDDPQRLSDDDVLRLWVRRAISRVRQRLLTQIGFTSRAAYRRSSELTSDPVSKENAGPADTVVANDLLQKIKADLTPTEMLIFEMRLAEQSSREIANTLNVTQRTVQRALQRIAVVLRKVARN